MDRFDFWHRWLYVLSFMIIGFGLLMAIFNQSPAFSLFNLQIDPVFWDAESVPIAFVKFQSWVYGILGSTMVGWGLMLLFIVKHPFQKCEKWAWNAIATSLGFWYLLDTAISLNFGVNFNAVFNTLLLILILPPLVATRKQFK